MQQTAVFPHKDSSDSSSIFRTPGMHPSVNVKVRRRNQQQLSAFQSLFGQLSGPLDEDNPESISEQAAVFRRSGSSLENSLFCSNGRISFDALITGPLENRSKSKDDSFFSCASEFDRDEKAEDDLDDEDRLEEQFILENNDHDRKNNEQSNDLLKKTNQHTDHVEEDDEFKSVCDDFFESSILSARTGSSQTQFYTPKQPSLESNSDKNNEGIIQQTLQINKESVALQHDNASHIVYADSKTINANSNLRDKHISNRTTATKRSSYESTSKNNNFNGNQLCLNLLQSPFSPEKPLTKSRNAPNYQPPPLALSFDVIDSAQQGDGNNNNFLNLNNSQNIDVNTINNGNTLNNLKSQMNSKAEQLLQHPVTSSSIFPGAELKNKPNRDIKKRTCQSFQAPFRNPLNLPTTNDQQSFDFLDDPCSLAQSAPGNQDNFFQSQYLKQQQQQQQQRADIRTTSNALEKDKISAKNHFYETYSYFRCKGKNWSSKGTAQMNRLVERKNEHSSSHQSLNKNTAWNGGILNLTLLISIILEKHPGLLYMLSLNHMIGTCARGGLYFLAIVLSGKDIDFLFGFTPVLFFSRLYYTVSMYYLLFYFEQKSVSFRQISKIFNTPFSRLRTREDRSLAAEIINDNMSNTRYHAEIMAKRFFVLCPVEFNFIALSQITSGRKSNLYYISNFIYQGIESILLYPPAIIYCCLKTTNAKVVGLDFLLITKITSGAALSIFLLFCVYLIICGKKYIQKG